MCLLSSASKIFNAGDMEKEVRFVVGHLRNAYMNYELRINHVLLLTFHEVNFPPQVGWSEGGSLHRMASACTSFQMYNASYFLQRIKTPLHVRDLIKFCHTLQTHPK